MKIIDKIKNNTTELVFIYFLSVVEVYYVLRAVFNMDGSFALALLCAFVLVASALILSTISKKLAVLIYILAGLAIIVLVLLNLNDLSEFFTNAITSLASTAYIEFSSPIIIASSLSFVFLLVNYLIIKIYGKSIIALIISVALVCGVYFTYDYISITFEIMYLAVFLLIFINWLSPKTDDKRKHSLLSFVFVVLAAAVIAPITVGLSNARQEPLKWIDDIDWFEGDEIAPSTEYIIRIDGQTKLTSLDDKFNYSDTEMLVVTSPYTDRLRNKTFDLYTREGWEKAQDNDVLNQGYQYTNYELTQILNANSIPYTEYEMAVELSAHSQMLFAPLNSGVITEFDEQMKTSPYDELYFDRAMRKEEAYSLNVMRIDYSSYEFIEFINNSKSENIDNIENYLNISVNLKEDLRPLALGLTQDAPSNYEKAKIIESYLSSQFTYNILPPEKPQNQDFIKYFLFETKEGFCTHYASSMVMMLRSIEIPCRFVTGYLLDAPSIYSSVPQDYQQYVQGVVSDEYLPAFNYVEGQDNEFIVNKNDSHAWVEVWFDDYGWLTFEPTSRYQSPLSPGGIKIEEYDFKNIELAAQEPPEKEESHWLVILLSALGVAAVIFVVVIVAHSSRRTDIEKIDKLWKGIQRSYYRKKKVEKRHETAREFCRRADKENERLESALKIYEHVAYSGRDIAEWQMIKMQRLNKEIRKINRRYRRQLNKENRPINNVEPFRPVDN